jgi:hypothetical protein
MKLKTNVKAGDFNPIPDPDLGETVFQDLDGTGD